MAEYRINTSEIKKYASLLKAGDIVYLSGTVYTARDAAHKKIFELIESDDKLPFEIKDSVIYYAGPTPNRSDRAIGSCGPTTSGRMNKYTPKLLDMGLAAIIGKGERDAATVNAIYDNNAVYFCAIGGAGALCSKSIKKCQVIAFEELGCESVKRLEIEDFYTIVANANNTDIYSHR